MTAPGWGVIGLMVAFFLFLIYYHAVGKNFKKYATFRQALSFTAGYNLFLQFSIHGSKYLIGPETPIDFTFRGVMAWMTISVMLIGWISIFLLPKIIQEAAADTQRLKSIYEA